MIDDVYPATVRQSPAGRQGESVIRWPSPCTLLPVWNVLLSSLPPAAAATSCGKDRLICIGFITRGHVERSCRRLVEMAVKEGSSDEDGEEDGGCCGEVEGRETSRRSKSRRFVVMTCNQQAQSPAALTNRRKVMATICRKLVPHRTATVRYIATLLYYYYYYYYHHHHHHHFRVLFRPRVFS